MPQDDRRWLDPDQEPWEPRDSSHWLEADSLWKAISGLPTPPRYNTRTNTLVFETWRSLPRALRRQVWREREIAGPSGGARHRETGEWT